jgi:hypothetical protein
MRAAGMDAIVPIDDEAAIAAGLRQFLDSVRAGNARVPLERAVLAHSRRALTAELAQCFDAVTAEESPRTSSA